MKIPNTFQWSAKGVKLNDQIVTIVIANGKIIAIEIEPNEIDGYDTSGLWAIPALVDTHDHSRVMGEEHKEDENTIIWSAKAGGVLTIFDMPNNKKPIVNIDALEEKMARFANCDTEVRFWFGATPTNQCEYNSLMEYSHVVGVKFYLGSSTGDLLVHKESDQRKGLIAVREAKKVVAAHCENEEMMRNLYGKIIAKRGMARVADHCQIRDTAVEVSAVKQMLKLQRETGARVFLCHLSTPEAVELAKDAKDAGAEVYVEVCPHHLFFDQTMLKGERGAFYKMNPPLRTMKQVERLRELVFRNGYVDCIGTDHASHLISEKMSGEYEKTPSGVPGLETLFPSMFSFVVNNQMSLDRFISLTSRRAGEIFDLPYAGKIEVGDPANFLLVDPNLEVTWKNEMVHTKCGWTPFAGMKFTGNIKYVIQNGVMTPVH